MFSAQWPARLPGRPRLIASRILKGCCANLKAKLQLPIKSQDLQAHLQKEPPADGRPQPGEK
jgi:hypothetical protein